jgi:D-alanine-D-alanine ligase
MSEVGRVLVLAGGLSHERDVSLRSGRRVVESLRDAGVSVDMSDVDETLLGRLRTDRPDVVIPLLHGGPGEDGSLREVLELAGVPYVGADPMASRMAFDKPTAASVVAGAGLTTPESVVMPRSVFTDLGARALLDAVVDALGLPLIVKPTRGGSSLGVTVVRDVANLPAAMVTCFSYGEEALVQRLVEGTEVAVCVVDREGSTEALPLVEIETERSVYDYEARYTAGEATFFVPARLAEDHYTAAAEAGLLAHRALRLRDISRTDLIIDEAGTPWFLEVNVAPGMTETSIFPQAITASGVTAAELVSALVRQAQSRGAASAG